MPVTVRRIPNEPILVAVLTGLVDVPIMEELFRRSAELMQEFDGPVYRITDVREADSNFAEMMGVIQGASKGQPGSTTDPRVHAVFVGNNQWVQMIRTALHLKQFGGLNLPMFLTEEDALDYIRLEMQKQE